MPEQSYDWKTCMQHATATDVGMRRANNQDACVVFLADDGPSWYDRGHIFVVADGMGAHAAGELASKIAVDTIPHLYHKHAELSPPEAIQKAILETNQEIHHRGEANTEFHNMGTTCSVLLLLPQGALIAQVGDSRVYRVRDDRIEQLSFDHSLIWEMRAAGQIKADEIPPGIGKNIITRSLGPKSRVKVDLEGPFPVVEGDVFLLCSDGLTAVVEDEELGAIVKALPPKEACRLLIDLANLRGGPDNITLIVVKVTGSAITTAAAQRDPLTIGAALDEKREAHPALWIAAGVCLLAAVGMAVLGLSLPALISVIGALVAGAAAILQIFGNIGMKSGKELKGGLRLGTGPHARSTCPTGKELCAKFDRIVCTLRENAMKNKYAIDFDQYDEHCRLAGHAAAGSKFDEAVHHYARSISFMMAQFRIEKKKLSDSTIEY